MPPFRDPTIGGAARRQQTRRVVLLVTAMVAIFAASAWLLAGATALALAGGVLLLGALGIARVSPATIMELHQAEPLARPEPDRAAPAQAILLKLSAQAGFSAPPVLYRLPGPGINALAAGRPGRAAIGLSDEALHALAPDELQAVLAHELCHVAVRDTRLLALTILISRMTQGTAQLLLAASLILLLAAHASLLTLAQATLLGLATPTVVLLRLALSRSQEFAADQGAIELTGDAGALIRALQQIAGGERGETAGSPFAGPLQAATGLLRSHPSPHQRIRRLMPPDQTGDNGALDAGVNGDRTVVPGRRGDPL